MAELARLALSAGEKRALLKDLEKILAHFEELKTVNTDGVAPMAGPCLAEAGSSHAEAGGSRMKNAFREDEAGTPLPAEVARAAFPETQSGFLKIPPVFSAEGGEE